MSWIEDRPIDYDPDKEWDKVNEEWTTPLVGGGGRYKSRLVVVGQSDDGEGVIYYGDA